MRYATLLILALFSIGCSNVQSPTAVIRNAQLGEVNPESVTLNVDLLVSNPNAFSLPLSNTSYTLALADTKVLDGDAPPNVTVPANGSAPVMLPIKIRWEDILKVRSAIATSGGNIPYNVSAKVSAGKALDILGKKSSVPLSYSGTIPLRELLADPKILLNNSAAQSIMKELIGRLPVF